MDSYYLYIDESYMEESIIISALLTSYPKELQDFPISGHCNDKFDENISRLKEYLKNNEFDSSLSIIYSSKGKSLTRNEYLTLYFLFPISLNSLIIQGSSLTVLIDALDDRIKDYRLNINTVKSIIGKYIPGIKIYIPTPISDFLNKKGNIHKNGLLFVDCISTSLARGYRIIDYCKFKRGIKQLYVDRKTLESIVQIIRT